MNDTTHDAGPNRKRRGRRSPSRPRRDICRRDGCGQPVTMPDRSFCTGLCRLIERQQESAQRVCSAVGPSPATAELWASVVELSDAMSRYLAADSQLQEAARSVGMTDEQWQAIKEGRSAAA